MNAGWIAGTDHEVTVNTLSAGDFVGEMGFMDGTELYASKVALGETRVLGLEREKLESLLPAQPLIVYRVMRAIARFAHEVLHRSSAQMAELTAYLFKTQAKY